jgi:hypothetical protein
MMKRLFSYFFLLAAALLLTASCGHAGGDNSDGKKEQARADTGRAKITFTEYQHDFGEMTEGEVVTYTFHFRNSGTADLLITSVSASCGCTIPKYSKKPVKPGETGTIEIEFNSQGKQGAQRKSIAVRGNTAPPVTILQITARVKPSDEKY